MPHYLVGGRSALEEKCSQTIEGHASNYQHPPLRCPQPKNHAYHIKPRIDTGKYWHIDRCVQVSRKRAGIYTFSSTGAALTILDFLAS